jgi:hypothetical protein
MFCERSFFLESFLANLTAEFEIYSFNENGDTSNFVNNFSMKTEITSNLATNIVLGSTARGYINGDDASAISKLNVSGLNWVFDGRKMPLQIMKSYFYSYVNDGNNFFIDNIQIKGNSTTSINEVNLASNFLVQPNPTSGIFNVTSSNFNGKINEVSIVNILGKEVYRSNSIDNNTNLNFDLSEFSNGIYFLQIKTNKGNLTKKIVLTN